MPDDLENKAYKNGFTVSEEFLRECEEDFAALFPEWMEEDG